MTRVTKSIANLVFSLKNYLKNLTNNHNLYVVVLH